MTVSVHRYRLCNLLPSRSQNVAHLPEAHRHTGGGGTVREYTVRYRSLLSASACRAFPLCFPLVALTRPSTVASHAHCTRCSLEVDFISPELSVSLTSVFDRRSLYLAIDSSLLCILATRCLPSNCSVWTFIEPYTIRSPSIDCPRRARSTKPKPNLQASSTSSSTTTKRLQ